MALLDKLKDALISQTEKGVRFECANCGAQYDEAIGECHECGSGEVVEREAFEFRPQE